MSQSSQQLLKHSSPDEYRQALMKVRACIIQENELEGGTIWYSETETLVDYITNVLGDGYEYRGSREV